MDLRILDDTRSITPGDRVELRLQIRNDGVVPQRFRVRIVGAGSLTAEDPGTTEPVPVGAIATLAIALDVPTAQPAGDHRVGVEVIGDDGLSVIGQVTLSIASADQVALSLSPARVRGHRGGSFKVDLSNPTAQDVELDLRGEGDGLDVTVTPDHVALRPGEHVRLRGKVRRTVGRSAASGGERLFTVVAQGHSAPIRATAAFVPRAFVPIGLRKAAAIVVAMAVWAATLVTGLQYLDERNLEAARADAQALQEEAAAQAGAAESDSSGADADPPERLPLFDDGSVDVGGVVDLGTGDDHSGVTVALRPVSLAPSSPRIGKISALHSGPQPRIGLLPAQSTVSNDEGTWGFANIAAPGQYELKFSKPGFETQSHLVSVDAGDDPVELPITMQAGDGLLAGQVAADGLPIGGATVTITDGTVTYTTSTATEGNVGQWSVAGLETPGRYLVTVDRRGFGAETQAVDLAAGGKADDLSTKLIAGVGSISGSARFLGDPVGAINISATDGEIVREVSSLTEIDVGAFTLPQLPSPGTYTLTVSGEGFVTQTLDVAVDGNVNDVVLTLVSSSAIIAGTVTDTAGDPVSGVSIIAFDGVHTYKTTSAIEPPGSYELTGVEPGSYVVSFERFEYQPASSLVNVAAGDVRTLDVGLEPIDAPEVVSEASVSVSPQDGGELITGATIKLQNARTFTTDALDADNRYTLTGLPVGTYVLTVTHPSFQTVIQTVRLGPTTVVERTVAMQALGDLFGVVTDTDGVPIPGASVTVTFAAADSSGNPTTSSLDPLFTNAAGAYSIEKSLGAREYTVVYSAPGHAAVNRTFIGETGTSTELNVALFRQPRVVGVVRYRNSSGTPVALTGATSLRVEFRPAGSSDPFQSVAVSATDGSYEIPSTLLAAGSWQLQLSGLPARYATPPTMPDTANLVLNEVRTADTLVPVNPSLEGTVRVLDTNGALQPVASVNLQPERFDSGTGLWASVGSPATSNGSGQYSIDSSVLTTGTWRLQASSVGVGNIDTVTPSFNLALDTRPVVDVQVDANPFVSVTVKDKNLSTLSGVTVTYSRLNPTDNSVLSTGTSTTDTAGVATFTRTQIEPGRYSFTVSGSPGLQDELTLATHDLTANQILPLSAVLFPDPTVDGYVRRLNASSNWVGESGRTVTVRRVSDGVTVGTTTSGSGGYFSFDPDALDPGDFEVVLGANERTVTVASLANNEARTVELIVPQSSDVSGTLYWLNAAGQRVDLEPTAPWSILAQNVIVDHTATEPAVVEVLGDLSATGTGPAWTVSGQASGTSTYVVTVTDGRFNPANAVATVDPGTNPVSLDVALSPLPSTISGLVTADGVALDAATVTLTAGTATRTTSTDGTGAWSLNDLVPGTWTITVSKAGYQTAVEPGVVTVDPAASQAATTGELNELRTVTIAVEADGAALSGATVTLSPGTFTSTESTPGTHVFTGVPEGTYSISVTKSGLVVIDGTGTISSVPDVSVVWGADPVVPTVEMAAYGAISGILEGTTAGETNPLIGYTITATLAGGSGPGSVVTATTQATDGSFLLPDLRQGTWNITVSATGFDPPTIAPVAVVWNGGTTAIPTISLIAELGSIDLVALTDNTDPATPLGDVTVELRATGSETIVATMTTPAGTPADGVSFPNLDAGDWTITMRASGHAEKTIQYVLSRGEAAVIDQSATVLEGNSGGVVGAIEWRRSGSSTPVGPLSGATVLITKKGNEVARIDNAPSFYSVSLLTNKKHDVTVSKPGLVTDSQEINISNGSVQTADFVLVANQVPVTVVAQDDTGADLDGVQLTLTGFATYNATTASGSATFPGVEPDINDYLLTATKDGYDDIVDMSVTVAPGQAFTIPTLVMNRQGSASLVVEDDAGTALPTATVALTADPSHVAVYNSGTSAFEFTNLPTGLAHGITVSQSDHDSETTTTAVVVADGSEDLGTVVLNRTKGSLQVDVTDDLGAPLTGARVVVENGVGTVVGTQDPAGSSPTFSDLVLADGPYEATVTMNYRSTVTTAPTALVANTTSTVSAQLLHRPTLAVTVGADPLGPADPTVTIDLRLALDGTFDPGASQNISTPFTFPDLVSGTYDGYRVRFTGAGYHPVNQVVPLTIEQGLVTNASVTLVALGTIDLTVLDDNGDPLMGATLRLNSVSAGVSNSAPSSSAGGVYTFSGLEAATDYIVTVDATGFSTATSSTLTIDDTNSTTVTDTVNIAP